MPELLLGDETRKIFVNPYGDRDGVPDDVEKFLDYIRDRQAKDTFTEKLEQAVEKARTHKEWEVEYMNWRAFEMDYNIEKRIAREEGRAEGREEGRAEGHAEGHAEGCEEGECRRLIQQACKKKAKGLNPEEAAEQLETEVGQIRQIYEAIELVESTDDMDAIYEKLKSYQQS